MILHFCLSTNQILQVKKTKPTKTKDKKKLNQNQQQPQKPHPWHKTKQKKYKQTNNPPQETKKKKTKHKKQLQLTKSKFDSLSKYFYMLNSYRRINSKPSHSSSVQKRYVPIHKEIRKLNQSKNKTHWCY